MSTCTVTDCTRPHDAKGFCHVHYNRWKRTGDPTATRQRPRGADHWKWAGDEVGYSGIHTWLAKTFTKTGACESCGNTDKPTEWAYKTRGRQAAYKRDRSQWRELCESCHRRFDCTGEVRARMSATRKDRTQTHCRRGHLFTNETTHVRSNSRTCRICERAANRARYARSRV